MYKFSRVLDEKYETEIKEHCGKDRTIKVLKSLPAPYSLFHDDFIEVKQKFCTENLYPLDYEENGENYISCRYNNVFTLRQDPFSLSNEQHLDYPAASITMSDNQFNVLAEGPSLTNLNRLLFGLNQMKVNTLVAVGLPFEGREKYYNYMNDATKISAAVFFEAIAPSVQINNELTGDTNFEFYQYSSKEHGFFYVLHVPNWEDHGFPIFNPSDKAVLAQFFQLRINSCFHCSAGIGRSVALLLAKMVFNNIDNNWNNIEDARQLLKDTFIKIKQIKPGAGEAHQYLIVPGLVEDIYQILAPQLRHSYSSSFFINSTPHKAPKNQTDSKQITDENAPLIPHENTQKDVGYDCKSCMIV